MADTNKTVDLKSFAEQLVNLKVVEVNQLASILKEEYGIEPAAAAAPVVVEGSGGKTEEKEEKTSFNIVLKSVGDAKLKVIKAIKNVTGLGLKESKEIADGAPKAVKENVNKAEAEKIKKELEEAGAEITLE